MFETFLTSLGLLMGLCGKRSTVEVNTLNPIVLRLLNANFIYIFKIMNDDIDSKT